MSKFWQHFIQNGRRGHVSAYLGLNGHSVPIKRRLARRYQLDQATGVGVRAVEPYSPAEDAGILEGDVLVRLGDDPVTSADDLYKLLDRVPVEVPVPVLMLRGERCLERLLVTTGEPRPVRRRA